MSGWYTQPPICRFNSPSCQTAFLSPNYASNVDTDWRQRGSFYNSSAPLTLFRTCSMRRLDDRNFGSEFPRRNYSPTCNCFERASSCKLYNPAADLDPAPCNPVCSKESQSRWPQVCSNKEEKFKKSHNCFRISDKKIKAKNSFNVNCERKSRSSTPERSVRFGKCAPILNCFSKKDKIIYPKRCKSSCLEPSAAVCLDRWVESVGSSRENSNSRIDRSSSCCNSPLYVCTTLNSPTHSRLNASDRACSCHFICPPVCAPKPNIKHKYQDKSEPGFEGQSPKMFCKQTITNCKNEDCSISRKACIEMCNKMVQTSFCDNENKNKMIGGCAPNFHPPIIMEVDPLESYNIESITKSTVCRNITCGNINEVCSFYDAKNDLKENELICKIHEVEMYLGAFGYQINSDVCSYLKGVLQKGTKLLNCDMQNFRKLCCDLSNLKNTDLEQKLSQKWEEINCELNAFNKLFETVNELRCNAWRFRQ